MCRVRTIFVFIASSLFPLVTAVFYVTFLFPALFTWPTSSVRSRSRSLHLWATLFAPPPYINFFLCVSKYSHTSTHTSAHTLPKLIYLPPQTPCLIKILYSFEVAAPNYSHTLSHIPAHTLSKLIYPPVQYCNIFLHTFLFKQFPHQQEVFFLNILSSTRLLTKCK